MTFPSVSKLIHHAKGTFLRFPFAILISALGVWFGFKMIDRSYDLILAKDSLNDALMTCALGLPLFIAITLMMERRAFSLVSKILVQVLASALLFGYYFLFKGHALTEDYVRFFVLNAGLHFFVAFAPFIAVGEVNGFWQYNKTLFLRIIVSGIYTGVLFAGLCIALVAIDNLLGVHINSNTYLRLWMVMAGIFNTCFFLAGMPENFEELNASDEYPKGLKIFTQFVLLPLVTVYLTILYLYIGKIFINLSLPHGWVSTLVICFSTVGVLSLLLIFPIKNREENRWIVSYSKWFYLALFPLIVLMFVSIQKRIADYGITEDRYYVLLLAVWLTFIAFYFTFSRAKNIKLIPMTLAAICFLSVAGPWSAPTVSIHSQRGRLMTDLEKEKIFINHKLAKATVPMADSIANKIADQFYYLLQTHGIKAIQPLMVDNLDSIMNVKKKKYASRYDNEYAIRELIRNKYLSDKPYIPYNPDAPDTGYSSIKRNFKITSTVNDNIPIKVKGYDLVLPVDIDLSDYVSNFPSVPFFNFKGEEIRMITTYYKASKTLLIMDDDLNKCYFPLAEFVDNKIKKDTAHHVRDENIFLYFADDLMEMTQENNTMKVSLIMKSIEFKTQYDSTDIEWLHANALIHYK